MIGHPGCRFQKVSRGIQRRADDQGGDRFAHGRDFRARRAADGQRRALGFDQMTVERIGDVRNDDWTQSEGFSRCSRPSRKTACSRSATCCAAPSVISSASTTWSVVRRSCAACSTRPGWSPKGTPRCRFAAKRAPARSAPGALRAGARRDAFSRRNRRRFGTVPGQAAGHPAGRRVRARRRPPDHQGRCAGHCRH